MPMPAMKRMRLMVPQLMVFYSCFDATGAILGAPGSSIQLNVTKGGIADGYWGPKRGKSGVVGRHIGDLRTRGNQIGLKWGNNRSSRWTTEAK